MKTIRAQRQHQKPFKMSSNKFFFIVLLRANTRDHPRQRKKKRKKQRQQAKKWELWRKRKTKIILL